jgi:hypothetical protein
VRCADPFHVVAWAIEALDVERRRAWNQAKGRKAPQSPGRRGRTTGDSRQIARSRYALWKNPDDLNPRQQQQLDWIAKTDPRLWRAYLLKEGLRYVFATKGDEGRDALDRWLTWARRSQLESFTYLAKKITRHREAIEANLEHGLSQGLIESTNTKIRLLTRIAFGFHGPQPLIALAMRPRLGREVSGPDVIESSDECVDVGGEEAGVAVHGHRNGGVAEVELDGFGAGVGCGEQTGTGVSQVVNPQASRQFCLFDGLVPICRLKLLLRSGIPVGLVNTSASGLLGT